MSIRRRTDLGEKLYYIQGHEPGNLFDDPEWSLWTYPVNLKRDLEQIARNHGGYIYTSIKEFDFNTGRKKEIAIG